ncbi:methyltransferase domain-containing protein [Alteromonas genovensis]|uniref:Methyltransferase domain-containing protein n=1 Tax=Alteromonas genovensis TaxID=471225 RepID=A0A6N9TD97_9ALTE|nr:methyltransferase domain-containing protein [Alteromonas genovensis]
MNEFCAQAANALAQEKGAVAQEKGLDRPTPLQNASKSLNISSGISEKAVAERFSKAAPRYDKLAAIQHTIAQHGLHNLPAQLVGNALDIGCGTGVHTQSLNARGLHAVGVDIAQGMLSLAGTNYPHLTFKLGSAQALPIASNSIDVAFSSMALQWANCLNSVAEEVHRVLNHDAIAELAIMVSGSFEELTHARKLAQLPTAMTPLPTADGWNRAFRGAGLAVKRVITRDYVDSHSDIMSLLRSVKGVGAGETGKQQKVLSRQDIKKLSMAYHNIHGEAGSLPLTYRVCHFRLEKKA